jgi:hypothetical protein
MRRSQTTRLVQAGIGTVADLAGAELAQRPVRIGAHTFEALRDQARLPRDPTHERPFPVAREALSGKPRQLRHIQRNARRTSKPPHPPDLRAGRRRATHRHTPKADASEGSAAVAARDEQEEHGERVSVRPLTSAVAVVHAGRGSALGHRPEQARSGSVLGRSHLGVSGRAERDAMSFGSLGCRPDQRPASGEHEVRRPADARALLRADGGTRGRRA